MTEYEPRWDLDYEFGRQGELWVTDIRDALAQDAVEVKYDSIAHRTGNLYVEYECLRRGQWQPSGIATTSAKLWVFVLAEQELAVVAATEYLRGLARELFATRQTEQPKGTHPTRGVLVPVSRLIASVTPPRKRGAA